MYKVVINELYLVQISGLLVHMGTIKHTLPATSALNALVTAAELIHKAATVTFNNAHIARAINTRRRLMKTKRERRKIPSSAQSPYTNESLNSCDVKKKINLTSI